LNVGSIKRARDIAGVDLLDSGGGAGSIAKLISDPVALSETIYAVCKPQADERGISIDGFCESMFGDCIERATTSLLGALVDFTPNPKDRENLRAAIDRTNAAIETGRTEIRKFVESGAIERDIDEALSHLLDHGKSFTNSQANSE
jgi:hypothetical protein